MIAGRACTAESHLIVSTEPDVSITRPVRDFPCNVVSPIRSPLLAIVSLPLVSRPDTSGPCDLQHGG